MPFKADAEKIKRWREERRWSQEHLAELSGLGLRTIQRIETGQSASYESLMALAAAYNVDVMALSIDQETEAAKMVERQNGKARGALRFSFLIHFVSYILGVVIFLGINIGTSSNVMLWALIWWTVGIVGHAVPVVIVEVTTRYSELFDLKR